MRDVNIGGDRLVMSRGFTTATKPVADGFQFVRDTLFFTLWVAIVVFVFKIAWLDSGLGEEVWSAGRYRETFTSGVFAIVLMWAVFVVLRKMYRLRFGNSRSTGLPDTPLVSPEDRMRVARHEAIHAVTAASLGVTVTQVSTFSSGISAGEVQVADHLVGSTADAAFADLVIAIAPHVDQIDRNVGHVGSRGDLRHALECAYAVQTVIDDSSVEEIMADGRDEARRILRLRPTVSRA